MALIITMDTVMNFLILIELQMYTLLAMLMDAKSRISTQLLVASLLIISNANTNNSLLIIIIKMRSFTG